MSFQEYFSKITGEFRGNNATEHSYRPALKNLLESVSPEVQATNEPKRQQCGAPDFVITKKQIPLGYVEAKDIGIDLDAVEKSDQMKRYLESLENLILTDYLEFRFYRNGQKLQTVQIGKKAQGKLQSLEENFAAAESLLKNFISFQGQTITSAKKLAGMMAGKARLMRDVLLRAVQNEDAHSQLSSQLDAFRKILIHDMTAEQFADVYAQTISYGLFAARLHDDTMGNFSRQEAAYLLPKSNPFLRKLFNDIAGIDLDERITWIVDELAELFSYCDIREILKDFGKGTRRSDPILHFYETFLAEYDPKLRKSRGVYYTPEPVVDFIVRAVDDILKTEFGLQDGLADTAKTEITVQEQGKKIKKQVHRVQILDPAVGTGTFLNDIIRLIAEKFESQKGIWQSYVEEHLIPRLHGFELLMASYAMCHLKLDLTLEQSGFDWKKAKEQRLGVYLTNSLEEADQKADELPFHNWLSEESREASFVKRYAPVMVVVGNPPYAVSSSNASIGADGKKTWIGSLLDDYKKDLNEKKINLDDDYIKFLRYAEHFIEKNGQGIVAMITNNSYIDGVTHRRMRQKLMETFDKIYIYDLHGSTTKKEKDVDGGKDENVFDIQQGVSISIFVKTGNSKNLGEVFHYESFGMRARKYERLNEESAEKMKWQKLRPVKPYFFFVPKKFESQEKYEEGIKINELFIEYNTGVQTKCDKLSIQFDQDKLRKIVADFQGLTTQELKYKYSLEDSSGWNVQSAKVDLTNNTVRYSKILYRPFDLRETLSTGKSGGFIGRPRTQTMNHMLNKNNLGIVTLRINEGGNKFVVLCTNTIIEKGSLPMGNYSIFPLYLYSESSQQNLLNSSERLPNLNSEILHQIEKKLKLHFIPEQTGEKGTFSPENLLDYIYAILHSPTYREKYKEFLRIDFPRIPFVEEKEIFWKLVELGHELREYHLMTHPKINSLITQFPIAGSGKVEKVNFTLTGKETGKVWINPDQYFEEVPKSAWEFYIGGYQPAQKWLKDRKGRMLNFDDILHWQKIIVALSETERLMGEIDAVYKNF